MKNITFSPRLRYVAAKSPITLIRTGFALSAGSILVMSVALLGVAANTATASAQTVTFTGAGAVNFGTANVCPSGKTTPAPCNKTLTLNYDVTASGTLGTPQALTTGQSNLDYKIASGTTCTGSVTQGNTCMVNVAFAPIAPGTRSGAVEIVDGSGNVLATTYIYGSGLGPLTSFIGPEQTLLSFGSSTFFPETVAVDAGGNIFVVYNNNGVVTLAELLAVDGSLPANPVTKVLTEQYNPHAVAVDGAGNVFFTTYSNPPNTPIQSVIEILAAGGYSTAKVVATGFYEPLGIAVDSSGDVFVADTGANEVPGSIYEIPATGGYSTKKTLGGGFKFAWPVAVAVDGSGNLFVADENAPDGGVVDELTAAAGYTTVKTIHVSNAYLDGPDAIAIDPAGNLFIGFQTDEGVEEALAVDGVVPSSPAFLSFGNFSLIPTGIALDSHGNLFAAVPDSPGIVQELVFSNPPSINFSATYVGQTSSDSPQSVQIQNRGNANLAGTGLSISTNWDLVPGSGTPADCTASFSLAPAVECNISISFEPTEAGDLTGAVTIGDNSLNVPGSSQSIALSGIGSSTTAPSINSLNSTYGAPYSVVILTGTNFGATKGSSTVTFNGIAAPAYKWSNTSITVTVPANATTGNIVVTVDGEASNGFPFTVLPMPVVTGLSPASGPGGTIVTINGRNLLDYKNQATVTYSGIQLQFISQSSTALTVQVPPGNDSNNFHILINDTGINTPVFNVLIPEVTSLSTNYGAPYSVVTLTGNNFGASQGSSYIVFANGNPFDDLNPPIYYWSNTKILLTVPANASTASKIVVSVGGNYSTPAPFTVLPMPTVTGISPTSGPSGTVVTISGTNLLDHENKGTVTFNGKLLPIISQSSTAIKVAVPAGAVTGYFHVLINDTGMNTPTFTVTP
jgi:sugar lactone lactonase YvrE